jgi:signal transduction histidine kinase
VNAIVEQVVTAHRPRAEAAQLDLRLDFDPDLPWVQAAPDQLSRVVTNLVANAINYTQAGEVRVSTYRKEGRVCLDVRDTGIGIGPKDMPHLFERFYRGRQSSPLDIPGTGLGLAIVKEIVELHGGSVEVESRLGEGSTFRVWLPVSTGEHPHTPRG